MQNELNREKRKKPLKMKSIIFFALAFLINSWALNAQAVDSPSEIEQITATLMDNIEGTANGEPERLRRAFHPSSIFILLQKRTA